MLPQQGNSGKVVVHSTEIGQGEHISPPEISAVVSDFWPAQAFVLWPAEVQELYFAWLMCEYKGRVQ